MPGPKHDTTKAETVPCWYGEPWVDHFHDTSSVAVSRCRRLPLSHPLVDASCCRLTPPWQANVVAAMPPPVGWVTGWCNIHAPGPETQTSEPPQT